MLYTNLCTEFLSQDPAIIENSNVSSTKAKRRRVRKRRPRGIKKRGKDPNKNRERIKRETRHNFNMLIF